jgi:murein DD-endopeptidase MepM/ murein hydrolase activator NlpD
MQRIPSPVRSTVLTAVLAISLATLLVGTALARPGRYIVRDGDYLSRIAQRCGVATSDINTANKLSNDLIHPGQDLVVPDPFRRTAASAIEWRPPYNGNGGDVLNGFGPHREGRIETRRTGVDMALPPGSNIYAPANGVVRYRGHQDGYGVIMIIEHGAHYSTVLGPFDPDAMYADLGRIVLGGDILGRSGGPAEGPRPYLHIELRRHNEAVDPARLTR